MFLDLEGWPRLEYSAPRNLYAQTLELNVELLNQYKQAFFPSVLNDEARERALVAIVDPLLDHDRFDLVSLAIETLATVPRQSDASLYLAMAAATIYSTQYADAAAALAKAADAKTMGPRLASYREELLARLLERQGDRQGAIEHYRAALAIDSDRSDYLLNIANLYAFERRWSEAAQWLQRYVESNPYPPAPHRELLGDYLLAAGRERAAVAAYEQAIELDPWTQQARVRLAEYHAGQGRSEEAVEMLRFLSTHAPDRSDAIYDRLAALHIERGNLDAARCVLAKGARIFPSSVALYNRRRELEELGD